ncbi:MAG: hypothetical protein KKF44_02985 [Nanoarchaeota archaeon]|nr:hypothetical protein [Nanoarchaeota archaeon]
MMATKKKKTSKTKKDIKKTVSEKNTTKKKNDIAPSADKDIMLLGAILAIILMFGSGFLVLKYKDVLFKNKEVQNGNDSVIEESLDYDGFTFEKIDGIWYSNVEVKWMDKIIPYSISTYYSPKELEDIEINTHANVILKLEPKATIFFAVDPGLDSKSVIAGTEVSKILGKVFFLKVKSAFSKETVHTTIPVVTCENITKMQKVIMISPGEQTKVTADSTGCIHIEGPDGDELIRAADRLVFNLLGIEEEQGAKAEGSITTEI